VEASSAWEVTTAKTNGESPKIVLVCANGEWDGQKDLGLGPVFPPELISD